MDIEFRGSYDKETVFKAVKLANSSKRASIVQIGIIVLLVIILVAYFVSMISKDSWSTMDYLRSGRHLITLPLLIYFLLQPHLSSRKTASAIWKKPSISMLHQGIINTHGITYRLIPSGQIEIEWSKFVRKVATDSLIVLLTAEGTISIFPRSFFVSEQEWQIVTQWINARVVEAS